MTLTAPDPEPELEQNYVTNISLPPYDQHKDGKLYKILIDESIIVSLEIDRIDQARVLF